VLKEIETMRIISAARRRVAIVALLAAGLGAGVALPAFAAPPKAILPDGREMTGISVRANEKGEILLQTANGVLTLEKGTKVVMDAPSAYTQAVSLMQQGKYRDAASTLTAVIKEYRFLDWDMKALRLLPLAYLKASDFARAAETYEALFKLIPSTADEPDMRTSYLEALLGAAQYDKAAPFLDETIRGSSRDAAAEAQLMRGRMRMQQGDIENAMYDFLRTAFFFRAQESAQPEALYQAAECMRTLGDERAPLYYKQVVEKYPESSFASKAKARM
jgi:TolA-binding protein